MILVIIGIIFPLQLYWEGGGENEDKQPPRDNPPFWHTFFPKQRIVPISLALWHYRGRLYSVPFVRHRGAYSVLPTHNNLCKRTPVKQVVVAAIVILNNIYHARTMYLCMDFVKFLLEEPGTFILWGHYYFVTTCRPIWGRFY